MLTPLCHALSGSFFLTEDNNCTGHYPDTILTYSPTTLTPLLPGYCYPTVHMDHQYYYASSLAAYCDVDGTAHVTVYQDETMQPSIRHITFHTYVWLSAYTYIDTYHQQT